MSVPRGQLQIFVTMASSPERPPVMAYLAGTTYTGYGPTVAEAIEDLLVCERVGRLTRRLEQDIEQCWSERAKAKPQSLLENA